MVKSEWGTKRQCQACGVPFYDLRKSPVVCPKCGATQQLDAPLRSRRTRVVADADPLMAKKTAALAVDPLVDDVADTSVVEDGFLEDAEEFEEDDVLTPGIEDEDGKNKET